MVGSQAKLRAPQSPAVPARKLIIKPLKSALLCSKQCGIAGLSSCISLELLCQDVPFRRHDSKSWCFSITAMVFTQ